MYAASRHHVFVATVLIVDDHPSFRATARAILEADGFEVVGEAEDGTSAVEAEQMAAWPTSRAQLVSDLGALPLVVLGVTEQPRGAETLTALQAELLLIETLTATGRVAEARAGALHVSARCAEVGLPRLLVDAGLS